MSRPAPPTDDVVRAAADELLNAHRAGGAYRALRREPSGSTPTAPRSTVTMPRSPRQCWTPPPSNTPMAQNDDGRTAKMTTATARSSAYEAKTEIYDGISKY